MYEELFQSPTRPFRATPDVRFYFPHESIETARQTVLRAIQRAEGPVMVLGGAGMGKSLLGELITGGLGDQFDIVNLQATRLSSRKSLLQNILFELRLPYRDLSEGELRLSILDRLEPSDSVAPDGVLIVVDEAHTVPAELLEELRLITNFTRNSQPRARLVLIGSMQLEDTFASPQMESFNQRLAARCYLSPMTREQTYEYVSHQIATAGYNPNEFMTSDGLSAVYAACEGIPRLTNQIMDHALVLAITSNQCPISSALVEEAWADLQQLPAPWQPLADQGVASETSETSVIEFGSLDDDDVSYDPPAPAPIVADHSADRQRETLSFEEDEANSESGETESLDAPVEPLVSTPLMPEGTPSNERSFFAAFAEPQQDDLTQALNKPEADLDLSEDDVPLVRPEFVFDSSTAFADNAAEPDIPMSPRTPEQGIEQSIVNESPILPPDSFFTELPTDEKMLAFAEEQEQYDAMGVWENDPPISKNSVMLTAEPQSAGSDQLDGGDQDTAPETAPETTEESNGSSLFGDDFDDEVSVSLKPVGEVIPDDHHGGSLGEIVTPLASGPVLASEASQTVEDPPTAENNFSEKTIDARVDLGRSMDLNSVDLNSVGVDSEIVESAEPWSLDVAAIDIEREIAVQHEIEDIVSQLNFSAFDFEAFSVEQITLDPESRPSETASQSDPIDSGRHRTSEEVYSMHGSEEHHSEGLLGHNIFTDASVQYDDDRDLLVIEEDLPVRTDGEHAADQVNPKRITPYTQLFAKLRK